MSRSADFCPYVGLDPFERRHKDYFFGRNLDSAVLADNVLARPVCVLYGASGVGKSSVLNVGLPKALLDLGIDARLVARREWHKPDLLAGWLDTAIVEARTTPARPLILILDQFEEYFLYRTRASGEAFEKGLAALVAGTDIEAHLLFSLRDDGLHHLDSLRLRLPGLLDTTLELRHLDDPAVERAIRGPLDVYNKEFALDHPVTIEDDLVEAVLTELRGKGGSIGLAAGTAGMRASERESRIETPLLQLVMTRLWKEEMDQHSAVLRVLTLRDKLRGVKTLVQTHLDEVMDKLSPDERDLCARFFDRLVTPSGTKFACRLDDLARWARDPKDGVDVTAVVGRLVGTLVQTRILLTLPPPPGEDVSSYAICHDVLASAVLGWQVRYLQASELAKQKAAAEAAARQREFALKTELDEQRRQARTRLRWSMALGAVAVLAIGAGLWAWLAQKQMETVRFTAAARAQLPANPAHSLWLAIAAAAKSKLDPPLEELIRQSLSQLRPVAVMEGHRGPVNSVAFSPDGRRLVTASQDGTARIWNAATGDQLHVLGPPGKNVSKAEFSADGTIVLTRSDDNTARLWKADGGPPIAEMNHPGPLLNAALSPDGTRVVTTGNDAAIWDARAAAEPTRTLSGHTDGVFDAQFSHDGTWVVTASGDGTTRLWSTSSREKPLLLKCKHRGPVRSVRFSPDDGLIVTAGDDKVAQVCEVAGAHHWTLKGHPREVQGAAFSQIPPYKILAFGGLTARVWSGDKAFTDLVGHTDWISSAQFSPDGTLVLTASEDGTARVWHAEGIMAAELYGHQHLVSDASFSPDGRYIATAGYDGTARVWSLPVARPALAHRDWVLAAKFSRDGRRVVTVGADKQVLIWDAETGDRIHTITHTGPVGYAALSPDGQTVVTASGSVAWVVDVRNGKFLGTPIVGESDFTTAQFGPGGALLVTGTQGGVVGVWNATTGIPVAKTSRLSDGKSVVYAAFDPAGKLVFIATSDGLFRVWRFGEGDTPSVSYRTAGDVFTAAFSRDGTQLATVGSLGRTAQLWRVDGPAARLVATLSGHTGRLSNIAFSPDGARVVTGSGDRTTRVWDARTGRSVAVLRRHTAFVNDVEFSPDGKWILSASDDRTAKVYPCDLCVPSEELVAFAKKQMSQGLTKGERAGLMDAGQAR